MSAAEELVGPAFDCPMHGSRKEWCCPRARKLRQLRKSQSLGGVPRASRIEARHRLQQLHSEALELRAAMLREELPVAGAWAEVDDMIAGLVHVKRMLGWKPPAQS